MNPFGETKKIPVPVRDERISGFEAEADVSEHQDEVGSEQVSVGQIAQEEVLLGEEVRELLDQSLDLAPFLDSLFDLLLFVLREEEREDSVENILGDSLDLPDSGLVFQILSEEISPVSLVADVVGNSSGFGKNEMVVYEEGAVGKRTVLASLEEYRLDDFPLWQASPGDILELLASDVKELSDGMGDSS